jgi:hypothetical protein
MYALVDGIPFKAGNKPKTDIPNFPKILDAGGITPIAYTCEQTISITRKFNHKQDYYRTCINIYPAVYDMLDSHIRDAYKVLPPTSPPIWLWMKSLIIWQADRGFAAGAALFDLGGNGAFWKKKSVTLRGLRISEKKEILRKLTVFDDGGNSNCCSSLSRCLAPAVYDTLDSHIRNAYKVSPPTSPPIWLW